MFWYSCENTLSFIQIGSCLCYQVIFPRNSRIIRMTYRTRTSWWFPNRSKHLWTSIQSLQIESTKLLDLFCYWNPKKKKRNHFSAKLIALSTPKNEIFTRFYPSINTVQHRLNRPYLIFLAKTLSHNYLYKVNKKRKNNGDFWLSNHITPFVRKKSNATPWFQIFETMRLFRIFIANSFFLSPFRFIWNRTNFYDNIMTKNSIYI